MLRAYLDLLSRLSFALRDAQFKSLVMAQAGCDQLMEAVRRISDDLPKPREVQTTNG